MHDNGSRDEDEIPPADVRCFHWVRMRVPSAFYSRKICLWRARELAMKPVWGIALVLACLLAAAPRLRAQAQPANNAPSAGENPPASAQQPSRVQKQSNANPFPEDESTVPVIRPGNVPDLPPGENGEAGSRMPVPSEDFDPVRSPEVAGQAAEEQEQSSSSSLAGMDSLLPSPDDDTQPGKHNRKGAQIVPEHHETAAEDENVGNYYLDNKDWKAALSRFESALVLDPDNPDVYWGLAESERHLGDFASARANYMKVTQYDPDSHHAKEALKVLKEPEIANAKASSSSQPAAPAMQ
jgi:tetratricopeptide (TPR) repeat protein